MDRVNLTAEMLEVQAVTAEEVTWHGKEALLLESGLALIPDAVLKDATLEVSIGTEGPAYPGLVFRAADNQNFELVYAVPHVSGQWDAIQYDPVFRGSNTWQLYYGPGYQIEAQVPTNQWFSLKLRFSESRAEVSVDGQQPLAIGQLAHSTAQGRFGLWTFRPAYFADLQISPWDGLESQPFPSADKPSTSVTSWLLKDHGTVDCEPNGVLNLNRWLAPSVGSARLTRKFVLPHEQEVALDFGFSDVLTLMLDDEVIFEGENRFAGFDDRKARGYVEPGTALVNYLLQAGTHEISAILEVHEGFGWGLILEAVGYGLRWLPPET